MSGSSSLYVRNAAPRRKGAMVDALLFVLALGMLAATAFTTRLHAPASPAAARFELPAR